MIASAISTAVILSGCGGNDDTTAAPANTTAATTTVTTAAPTMNIVELAQSVDDLSTLVSAVTAGDLVDTLSNATASFTVFAPTNAAFDALPEGTLTDLLKPENKQKLVGILTYHVLSVEVLSTQLKASQDVTTVEGDALAIVKDDTGVHINNGVANVTAADNMATNGVAHIIDGVLLPPTSITV